MSHSDEPLRDDPPESHRQEASAGIHVLRPMDGLTHTVGGDVRVSSEFKGVKKEVRCLLFPFPFSYLLNVLLTTVLKILFPLLSEEHAV